MNSFSRRRYIKTSAGALLASVSKSHSQEEDAVQAFMGKFKVPGLSLAIAKNGRIVRREAFGFANLEKREPLDASSRFRIASVSKPITSVAIFLLVEHGRLRLDDLIFGDRGILEMDGPEGITVAHLLTHTAGGWQNDRSDPMFKEIRLDHRQLIAWVLENLPPKNKPGETFAYSNFGYCLLGRVIEKVSGRRYEAFVRENVLELCGAEAMTIGRGEREVAYYMYGKPVPTKMNIARMDAHGGWVGTPAELVNFALCVDGFAEPTDVLTEKSIAKMISPGPVNDTYACGWNVNKVGNYWHGGSLPGLTSLLVRTSGGYCWAACANSRSVGVSLALDRLMWKLVSGIN